MQIANVYFGGTLIPDIPSLFHIYTHLTKARKPTEHIVTVTKNTLLAEIIHQQKGEVFSAHHQAVDEIGDGLQVNALALDQIVEGLEWKNGNNKSPIMLLQWHPERMKNLQSNFSTNIREYFLDEVRKTK